MHVHCIEFSRFEGSEDVNIDPDCYLMIKPISLDLNFVDSFGNAFSMSLMTFTLIALSDRSISRNLISLYTFCGHNNVVSLHVKALMPLPL